MGGISVYRRLGASPRRGLLGPPPLRSRGGGPRPRHAGTYRRDLRDILSYLGGDCLGRSCIRNIDPITYIAYLLRAI